MISRRAIGFAVWLAWSVAGSTDSPPIADVEHPIEQELAAIREQLVALEIEKAQLALNALLERSELPEASRVEALDLRAQAAVASDDIDSAERDYGTLLALRPGYFPNREVTSKKAMDRFLKLQAATIGTIRLDLDPKDASVTLDERPVSPAPDGSFAAVFGDRKLRVARKGFDSEDVSVQVVAGRETPLTVHLVPNARALVVRTDVEGVAVTLDGGAAGVTARDGAAAAADGAPAVLVIEDVAIGEHDLRLAKPCFATESLHELVSVDLSDRTPKVLRVVTMRPARTRVTASGADYQGELRVDGGHEALLPLSSFTMCPGLRALEVVASGRIVWSGNVVAEEADLTIDLSPRPNAVVVGASWPASWVAARATWNAHGQVDAPVGVDLTRREGWEAVSLPPGTDLALAVIGGAGLAGEERIVLYSPVLHEVEERAAPPDPSAPRWSAATLGAVLVDAGDGSVVVASTSPAGPAARAGLVPGDRVMAIAGRVASNAAAAAETVAAADVGASLILDVTTFGGPPRKLECATTSEPRMTTLREASASRVVGTAWALTTAAAGGPDAAIAFANLAMALERSERDAAALEAWRRVRAIGDRTLAARAAYALGAGLQNEGKRSEAIEALSWARAEAMQGGDRILAAAASDRLADLGVTPR